MLHQIPTIFIGLWIYGIHKLFCFVSGKITKTTQWNPGHTFAFRLPCIKPEVQGRMAPMFHPAHNREDMRAFRIDQVLQPNNAKSVVSGGLGKMYRFVFQVCSARRELQPRVVLTVVLNSITLSSSVWLEEHKWGLWLRDLGTWKTSMVESDIRSLLLLQDCSISGQQVLMEVYFHRVKAASSWLEWWFRQITDIPYYSNDLLVHEEDETLWHVSQV